MLKSQQQKVGVGGLGVNLYFLFSTSVLNKYVLKDCYECSKCLSLFHRP